MNYLEVTKRFITGLHKAGPPLPEERVDMTESIFCKLDMMVGIGEDVVCKMSDIIVNAFENAESIDIHYDLCAVKDQQYDKTHVMGYFITEARLGTATRHYPVGVDVTFHGRAISRFNLMSAMDDRSTQRHIGYYGDHNVRYMLESDIDCIEVIRNNIIFHCTNGEICRKEETLAHKEKSLSSAFLKTGRSFLVNMDKVERILMDKSEIVLPSYNVPVSQKKIAQVRNTINNWHMLGKGAV